MQMFGNYYDTLMLGIEELNGMVASDPHVQRILKKGREDAIAKYVLKGVYAVVDSKQDSPSLLATRACAFFGSVIVSKRVSEDDMLKKRNYVSYSTIDGQHRVKGAVKALKITREKLKALNDVMSTGDKHVLRQYFKMSEVEQDAIRLERDRTARVLEILEETQIPVVVFLHLDLSQEQQLFHDVNTYGQKVSKSLCVQRNNADLYSLLAKELVSQGFMKNLVEENLETGKPSGHAIFTLSAIRDSVYILSKGELKEETFEFWSQEVTDMFRIFVDSLPKKAPFWDSKLFLYLDSKVIKGVATFTRNMMRIEGVDWRNTLTNALDAVKFNADNLDFAKHGNALVGDDGRVRFTGTGTGTAVVLQTLHALSDRLDSNGKKVFSAYNVQADPSGVNAQAPEPTIVPAGVQVAEEESFKEVCEKTLAILEQHGLPMGLVEVKSAVNIQQGVAKKALTSLIEGGKVRTEKRSGKTLYTAV